MAPKYAYSFAPDIMDYQATKFQYPDLPRLAIEAKLTSSSQVLPALVFGRGVQIKKSKLLQCRAPLGGSQNWNPMVKMCSKK